MIQQLEFTSAPRGLVPGASGYCTVKQTQGLSTRLRKTLEGISSYRHVYAIHDALSAKNPVDYRHVVIREGTQQLFILSRTCNSSNVFKGMNRQAKIATERFN